MLDILFRLPGKPGDLFYERLKWKIHPLLSELTHRGYSVKCGQSTVKSHADVNVWIINEVMPTIAYDQKNIVWFCHRMEILCRAELHAFDGIMTTSHPHAKFLKHLMKSERPVTYLPWPIDLEQTTYDRSTSASADWVVMWNVHQKTNLLPGEQWAAENARRFQIYGQRWSQHVGNDHPSIPCGTALFSNLKCAPGYWNIDLLRNRASGFIDSFALYALASGKRVYSDIIGDLPKALEDLVTMLDFQSPDRNRILSNHPLPLSQKEYDRACQYLGHHHSPKRMADRLERMLGRLRRPSLPARVSNAPINSNEIHLYQDEDLRCKFTDCSKTVVTPIEAATAMERNVECTLVFHAAPASSMAPKNSHVQHEVHIQNIAIRRLKAAEVALRYPERLKIVQPTVLESAPAPIHDLSDILFRVENWSKGGREKELLLDLRSILDRVPIDHETIKSKVHNFDGVWQRVANETLDPKRSAYFLSCRMNAFDRHTAQAAKSPAVCHSLKKSKINRVPRCAVFIHIFYPEFTSRLLRLLDNITVKFRLYIATTDSHKAKYIEDSLPNKLREVTEIRVFKNKGRDVFSKLFGFSDAYDNLDLCLHIHTKKSPHSPVLSSWREKSFEALLGTPEQVQSIFSAFDINPEIGLICPNIPNEIVPGMNWMRNWRIANYLNRKLNFSLPAPGQQFAFPAGSMFWVRANLLQPIIDLKLSEDDFPSEENQQDGTLAHAIERMIGLSIIEQNKHIAFVDPVLLET